MRATATAQQLTQKHLAWAPASLGSFSRERRWGEIHASQKGRGPKLHVGWLTRFSSRYYGTRFFPPSSKGTTFFSSFPIPVSTDHISIF
jgi:hypothetical protein